METRLRLPCPESSLRKQGIEGQLCAVGVQGSTSNLIIQYRAKSLVWKTTTKNHLGELAYHRRWVWLVRKGKGRECSKSQAFPSGPTVGIGTTMDIWRKNVGDFG